jgi:hypothetical protein
MARLNSASRSKLPSGNFAFPEQRKEPLENASHVRNAIARFDQVKDVSEAGRDKAWARIKAAAKAYGIEMTVADWRDLGKNRNRKK